MLGVETPHGQANVHLHAAENEVQTGKVYRVDVMTTGSPDATPLPHDFLDGLRDTRFTVIREAAAN